jgi:hypothetical protein
VPAGRAGASSRITSPLRASDGAKHNFLLDPSGDRREEVFRLLDLPHNAHLLHEESEAIMVRHLLPQTSRELVRRLTAIAAFESAGFL